MVFKGQFSEKKKIDNLQVYHKKYKTLELP